VVLEAYEQYWRNPEREAPRLQAVPDESTRLAMLRQ